MLRCVSREICLRRNLMKAILSESGDHIGTRNNFEGRGRDNGLNWRGGARFEALKRLEDSTVDRSIAFPGEF